MNKKGKIEPVLVSSTIVSPSNPSKALYILHKDTNRWGFPGGKLRKFESFSDAAKRETFEEIGVKVELSNIVGAYHYRSNHNHQVVNVLYRARIISGNPNPNESDIIDIQEFSLGQALSKYQRNLVCIGVPNISMFRDYLSGQLMPKECLKSFL